MSPPTMSPRPIDCVIIGYNEPPFDRYAELIRREGEASEAYRDLRLSFVDLGGERLTYVELLNRVFATAGVAGLRSDFRSGEIPSLAAVYLANHLRRRGFEARTVNLFQGDRELLADYLARGVRCVAITTTLYVINDPVCEMVEFIRRHDPRVPIVVGGPLIANHHRNYRGDDFAAALQDIGADLYVVEAQGEATLAALVECLAAGGDLARVPNLVYFEDGRARRTAVAPENNDLDANVIDWRAFAGPGLGATVQTRTARSCAFKCAFCNYPERAGRLSLTGLDAIGRELDSLRDAGGVRNLVFIDDTFNVPLPRFKEICRLLIERDYGFRWFSYFRCSNADEEALDLMAESGCGGVFLGIESGSPTVLENMNKRASVEQYRRRMAQLHERDILTFASFITGFPGETADTVAETADFIRATRPDYYRTQLWYCEAGTPVQREAERWGLEGDGFVWRHATMESLEAMDHIERLFLSLRESTWLPQWSFDFWIIPYLEGEGVDRSLFAVLMRQARELLALEVAAVPAEQKRALQEDGLASMVHAVRRAGGRALAEAAS